MWILSSIIFQSCHYFYKYTLKAFSKFLFSSNDDDDTIDIDNTNNIIDNIGMILIILMIFLIILMIFDFNIYQDNKEFCSNLVIMTFLVDFFYIAT